MERKCLEKVEVNKLQGFLQHIFYAFSQLPRIEKQWHRLQRTERSIKISCNLGEGVGLYNCNLDISIDVGLPKITPPIFNLSQHSKLSRYVK